MGATSADAKRLSHDYRSDDDPGNRFLSSEFIIFYLCLYTLLDFVLFYNLVHHCLILSVSVKARIYEHLKEVMQTVDLDEVTSKDIRLKVDFKCIFSF